MHKTRTNTNVLEINQSLIELLAEWRISEKDDEIIFTKIVGLQLKKIRLMRGYTQTRVAKAINITFQQIQKYERGNNEVKSINLKKLSEYFDVSFDYFIKPILDANLTFLTKRREKCISVQKRQLRGKIKESKPCKEL
jgi:transcriptional regulator with XRE-family HTH domain